MASKNLQNISDEEFKDIIKSSLTWFEAISKCGLKNKSRKFEIRIDNISYEDKKHLPKNYGGIYSKIEKYSHDFYKELIKNSNNWDEVIETLKITNQKFLNNVKKYLDTINIYYNHLTENNKIKHCKIRKLEEILVVNSSHSGSMTTIKKRLINELGWKWECSGCNKSTHFTHWTGVVKIPLQVDHINGDRTNNSVENLRLLCSSCHSLTSTYCGKNIKKEVKVINKVKVINEVKVLKEVKKYIRPDKETRKTKKCLECETKVYEQSTRCAECSKKFKINEAIKKRPDIEQIKLDLLEYSLISVANKYNVHKNTLKKWLILK